MKNTWHFTLPKTLLQPTTHRLAAQRGISTLSEKNIHNVLSGFQAFATYADLPLGLNPQKSRALRKELERMKHNRSTSLSELSDFVKKIKTIKEHYQHRKSMAKQNELSIFSVYESDDLFTVSSRVLTPISIYINKAKQELRQQKLQKETNRPIAIFNQFIQRTENLIQQHQTEIAHSMLLRLQTADYTNDIECDDIIQTLTPSDLLGPVRRQLTKQHFIAFHAYIEAHGSTSTKAALNKLSWIQSGTVSLKEITHPKRVPWPRWLFRGESALHQAFSDPYHQARLLLKANALKTINTEDSKQLSTVSETHAILLQEIQRLSKINTSLFPWFHTKARHQIKKRIDQLNTQRLYAEKLRGNIQTHLDLIEEKQHQQTKARFTLAMRSQQYTSKIAELYFIELIKNRRSSIIIDGITYENNKATLDRMKHALRNKQSIQIALLKKMELINEEEYSDFHQTVIELGTLETQSIWHARIDKYRLECFRRIALNPKNSTDLLNSFQHSLQSINISFPKTGGAATELHHFISLLPSNDWNIQQHNACELIDCVPILERYYQQMIDYCLSSDTTQCPDIADAILQRFAKDYLLEIEYPELQSRYNALTQRRLSDRKSQTTTALIQSELEQGHLDTAISRLKQIKNDVKNTMREPSLNTAKKQLIAVTNALTQTDTDPNALSQQLITQLRTLLHSKNKDSHYLDQLSEIKHKADTLPFSKEYATIKRLSKTAENITSIINELINTILAFANNEIETLSNMNSLLLDIIEFDLLSVSQQSTLQQLLESVLLDPEKRLPNKELKRLNALKNALSGSISESDRAAFFEIPTENRYRFTLKKSIQPKNQTSGEMSYAQKLRN